MTPTFYQAYVYVCLPLWPMDAWGVRRMLVAYMYRPGTWLRLPLYNSLLLEGGLNFQARPLLNEIPTMKGKNAHNKIIIT